MGALVRDVGGVERCLCASSKSQDGRGILIGPTRYLPQNHTYEQRRSRATQTEKEEEKAGGGGGKRTANLVRARSITRALGKLQGGSMEPSQRGAGK